MAAVLRSTTAAILDGRVAKVLIVDDDATLRTLMCVRLQKSGFDVIEAADGATAVEIFCDVKPDIVLMDANMPGIDGFEATRQLTSLPNGDSTPILMVSGLEDDESVDKAFSAGATEYITKPICWPLLLHRLNNICAALQAESNLIKAKMSADSANRSKTEFLANMSHELRTPMHAILSFASMGTDKVGKVSEEKLIRYFSRIEESGKRLLVMLNDLLDLSKLEEGKMVFNIRQNDILQTISAAIEELQSLLTDKKITVSIPRPSVASRFDFDSDRILQVIINLLSNGVKFSPEGSEITISINSCTVGLDNGAQVEAVRLTVKDQGIGIPEQELDSVFEKFVQSSCSKTGAGGSGLGLAICKQIAEYHHGRIYAENNNDSGTSFHLLIPKIRMNIN